MNSYELSRNWFDWCFENPEKISPNHTAMYFFIIEHCNRLGWKEKFGLPMEMTKDAIGIKNYRTYSNTLNDLIEWGFITLIQKSKNQYSSNVIAIAKNTKASTKALDKAMQKHSQKQCESIVCIDKPNNNITIEPNNNMHPLCLWIANDLKNVSKLKEQLTDKEAERLLNKYNKFAVREILEAMDNSKELSKRNISVNKTISNWIRRRQVDDPNYGIIKEDKVLSIEEEILKNYGV